MNKIFKKNQQIKKIKKNKTNRIQKILTTHKKKTWV